MGTAVVLSNTTIRLSPSTNLFFYVLVWAVCLAGIGIVLWAALRSKRWERWTTQDILIVAALGVLLEVYDNIIGDQFLKPIIDVIPGTTLLHVNDLPYMFLLMVGVALVRKPGCVTAMVFVNFLLSQLLFGSGHGALDWTDGLTLGVLRGGPNAFLTDWTFDPYLNATFYTWYQMWVDTWSNAVGNGVEAAVSAVLAHRVAVSVVPSLGASRSRAAGAPDPFAEPGQSQAGISTAFADPAVPGTQPSEGGLT